MARVTDLVNPAKPKRLVNHIALVVDTSTSMSHLSGKLQESLREQVNNIKKNSYGSDQETYVSIYTFADRVSCLVRSQFPEAVQVPYLSCHGWTALMDGVATAIRDFKVAKYADEPQTSFLIITLTDGEENRSQIMQHEFRRLLEECQLTNRWSFAFLVPPGGKYHVTALGVPAGNVQEWEASEVGMEQAKQVTMAATSSYYLERSAGRTSTQAFFPDLSKVKAKDLKKLDDVSKAFRRVKVDKEADISSFCVTKIGEYRLGCAYYQLTKPEKIQDHKKLVIEDKKTKKLYGGDEARNLIGIASGPGVTVRVSPGNHANFNIFVNSTSMNRKLVRGTELLVEKA